MIRPEEVRLPPLSPDATEADRRLLQALYDQFRDVGARLGALEATLGTVPRRMSDTITAMPTLTATYVGYGSAANALTGEAALTWDATNNKLAIAGGTVTASKPMVELTQTWNNAAVSFQGVVWDFTVTAAAALGTNYLNIKKGGVSQFQVGNGTGGNPYAFVTGAVGTGNGPGFFADITGDAESRASIQVNIGGIGELSFGPGTGARDAFMSRDSAGVLQINNGTQNTYRDLKVRNLITSTGVATATLTSSSLTTGRVPYVSTGGLLIDSTNFKFTDSPPRLTLSGITAGADAFNATGTANAGISLQAENLSTGTAGYAQAYAKNSTGYLGIQKYSTGYTTSGLYSAGIGALYNSTGNLIINAGAASTAVIVAAGGTGTANEIMRANTTGVLVRGALAIPAGGTAATGLMFSSTANFGVFFGSGAPSLSAAKGSLYLRSDGSGTNDRAYINTDGSTTWTALVTVA